MEIHGILENLGFFKIVVFRKTHKSSKKFVPALKTTKTRIFAPTGCVSERLGRFAVRTCPGWSRASTGNLGKIKGNMGKLSKPMKTMKIMDFGGVSSKSMEFLKF